MDEEGQDLPDEAGARDEAVKAARELMCDDVRRGIVTLSNRIIVESEDRQVVISLPFGEAVEIKA
jgi:hypothetical protein